MPDTHTPEVGAKHLRHLLGYNPATRAQMLRPYSLSPYVHQDAVEQYDHHEDYGEGSMTGRDQAGGGTPEDRHLQDQPHPYRHRYSCSGSDKRAPDHRREQRRGDGQADLHDRALSGLEARIPQGGQRAELQEEAQ